MRGKKPLSEKQVKSLRKLVEGNPLHELLLNLSVDLMLRGSDLLNLKVIKRLSKITDELEDSDKETGGLLSRSKVSSAGAAVSGGNWRRI